MRIQKTTLSAVTAYAKAHTTMERSQTKAIDLLIADGVKSTNLLLGKKPSEAHKKTFMQLKGAVIASFGKADQALLAKPAKSLSSNQKDKKRKLTMRIGPYMANLRKAMERRELLGTKSKAPNRKRDEITRLRDDIQDALKVLQGWEKPSKGVDVTALVKALNDALKALVGKPTHYANTK